MTDKAKVSASGKVIASGVSATVFRPTVVRYDPKNDMRNVGGMGSVKGAPVAPGLPDPEISGGVTLPSARTLTITVEGRLVARLAYHLTPPPLATMQILDMWVEEPRRRQKVCTRLWEMALLDARKLLGNDKLRRVHAGVGHKSHVLGRAFLTHQGFHHVTTTAGLYRGEDLLTYIKSYT